MGGGGAPHDAHGRLVFGPLVPEELLALKVAGRPVNLPPSPWVHHLPGDAAGQGVQSVLGWTGAAASAPRCHPRRQSRTGWSRRT